MSLVDVEYEKYPCPHCKGFIQVREQFYILMEGQNHTLQHIDEQGNETELELIKEQPPKRKRIIKSPPKPRPTSLRQIKEAVKKAPPIRAGGK